MAATRILAPLLLAILINFKLQFYYNIYLDEDFDSLKPIWRGKSSVGCDVFGISFSARKCYSTRAHRHDRLRRPIMKWKRSYISKKLVIGDLLKTQDHKICRKVSTILSHPLRAYFPETKTTRYNLRNKSPVMPAIRTNRFKNTFFNRIVFKYNVAL